MSIIQDALKKVQVDYAKKKVSPPKVKIRQRKKKMTPMRVTLISSITVVFISSILIIGLGVKLFLLFRETAVKRTGKEIPAAAPKSSPKVKTAPAIPEEPAGPAIPDFVLNGVMYLDGKPQAIINGYMLEEGDTLNGATVALIDKDYALLNLRDSKIKVKLNK